MELDRKIKSAIAAYMYAPSQAAADAVFSLSAQRAAMMKRPRPQFRPGWIGPWFGKPKPSGGK